MQASYHEYDPNHSALIPRTQHAIYTLLQCFIQTLFPHSFECSFSLNHICEAELNLQYTPPPSPTPHSSLIHLPSSILSYPSSIAITAETTLIHLCLSALTPCGEKPSIYLGSPCCPITSPRHPATPPSVILSSVPLSIHLAVDALPSSPSPLFSLTGLTVLQAITNYPS